MQILADDLSRYELLTLEKTESVLEEVEGHLLFPIQLPLEDGRPDGTVSDDTSNSSIHEYERFIPVSSEDWGQFLSANANKITKQQTNSDVNLFYLWARQNLEMRKIQDIPTVELAIKWAVYKHGCILECSKKCLIWLTCTLLGTTDFEGVLWSVCFLIISLQSLIKH